MAIKLDSLAEYESCLSKLEKTGKLPSVAENKTRFFKDTSKSKLAPILKDRLYQLGYLSALSDSEDKVTAAIESLQKEAGLKVDGWVGLQTWDALQELFTFENDSNLSKWNTLSLTGFACRAIKLRLIKLGFFATQTRVSARPNQNLFNSTTWSRWQKVLTILGVSHNVIHPQEQLRQDIQWLFDIDALTKQVVARIPDIRTQCADSQETENLFLIFLSSLLKIELWLHGFDNVKPDGKAFRLSTKPSRITTRRGPPVRRRATKDKKLLEVFWKEAGVTVNNDSHLEMLLCGFPYLADETAQDETQRWNKEQLVIQLNKDLQNKALEKQVKQTWQNKEQESQSWGQWIFDGFKRIYKKIKKWALSVVAKAKVVIRSIKQIAVESFSVVRRTYEVMSDGFRFLLDENVKGSNFQVAMKHDRDFDFKVFVSQNASNEDLSHFIQTLEQSVLRFKAASAIMTVLANVILGVVGLLSGPFSWWATVRSLIDAYRLLDSDEIADIRAAYI